MRLFGVAVLVLTFVQAAMHAQVTGPLIEPDCATYPGAVAAAKQNPTARPPVGDPEAGKKHYAFGNTSCSNCHGTDAQGAFGPTLAGRNWTYDLARNQIRKPCGIMPAFIDSQMTDQEIADLVAFWNSMPLPKASAAWRVALPQRAPKGQVAAVKEMGCGQCHGATLDTSRHGMAEVNGGWEWFKKLVYTHQPAIKEQWAMLDKAFPQVTPGPAGPPGRNRVRMGNYDRERLPEAKLREIFDWAYGLGPLPVVTARIMPSGNTYTIDVFNSAVKAKGLAVENLDVSISLPADVEVVSTTGTGYQGVQPAADMTQVAVWRLPRMEAASKETLTLELSAPAPTMRGTLKWAKPAVKADGIVNFGLPRGARGQQAAN